MMDLVELYVIIDDFCKAFMPRYLKILKNKKQITRVRTGMLSTSEIVWIIKSQGFLDSNGIMTIKS